MMWLAGYPNAPGCGKFSGKFSGEFSRIMSFAHIALKTSNPLGARGHVAPPASLSDFGGRLSRAPRFFRGAA